MHYEWGNQAWTSRIRVRRKGRVLPFLDADNMICTTSVGSTLSPEDLSSLLVSRFDSYVQGSQAVGCPCDRVGARLNCHRQQCRRCRCVIAENMQNG
jgi:hypothetical protein